MPNTTQCACSLIVSGDKAWFDLLDPTAKECLPVGFVKAVHSAACELNLSWCGMKIQYKGNFKANCSVRDVLAKKFPEVKNVFINDASGRMKIRSEKQRMKNLNLAEPSILVPLFPEEETMLLTGLDAKMDECLAHARKLANGRHLTLHVYHISNINVPGAVSKELCDSSLVMGTGRNGEKTPASIVELLPDNRFTTVGAKGAKVLYEKCPEGILVVPSRNRMLSAYIERKGQGLLLDKLDPTTETVLWRQTGNGGHGNTDVPKGPFCVRFAFMVHKKVEDDRIPASDGAKNKFSRTLPLRNAVYSVDLPENAVYVKRSELDTTSDPNAAPMKRTLLDSWMMAGPNKTPRTSSSTVRMVTPDNDTDNDDKMTSAPCASSLYLDEAFTKYMGHLKKEE